MTDLEQVRIFDLDDMVHLLRSEVSRAPRGEKRQLWLGLSIAVEF